MPPIPICMCGKQPRLAIPFSQMMLPEYDVVHHFQSTTAFHEEFPALMRGEAVKPRSGIGSNCDSDTPKKPCAIFVGADFSEEELQEVMQDCNTLPYLAPHIHKKDEAKKAARENVGGPSMMEMIVKRVKESLKEHGLVEGNLDKVQPDVWRF